VQQIRNQAEFAAFAWFLLQICQQTASVLLSGILRMYKICTSNFNY